MFKTKKHILLLVLLLTTSLCASSQFRIGRGSVITIGYELSDTTGVVLSALEILSNDMKSVLDTKVVRIGKSCDINIIIDPKAVKEREGFEIKVAKDNKMTITGHDKHGAAYGIMEISRLLGVSPWEWWADAAPKQMPSFELPRGYVNRQSPSVKYRGIFINDEDWGLMPWSSLSYEPWYKPGRIGPKTNAKIFELLLRLRANTYWPAMHECTVPFFLTDGNRRVAEKYGIYIGGSHCEPMACNAAGEWKRRGKGDYDYVHNSRDVFKFWEDRVKDVADQEIIYTLGMRGVHDGAMNGAKGVEEQKAVLNQVFREQRQLLSKYVNKDLLKVPQVFIPYKEVLDIYNAGLDVPEDVTLMWCDDNYGYIKHFPNETERNRKGGNGVYYHVSYWGRPHDYLWLGTFSPYLLYQQMKQAYDKGIQEMWVLNVGDIKPAEYQIELFMDMAWNIERVAQAGPTKHLQTFLCREFGERCASELLPVMNEYYRLAYIRKPEFMGNTREEEYHTNYYRIIRDLPWGIDSLEVRDNQYVKLSDRVETIENRIPENRQDAYFQLVKYPVQASAQMNHKMISAQKARHSLGDWRDSDASYDSIVSLTRQYNIGFHNNGKWLRFMDHQPRRLPVFEPVEHRMDSSSMAVPPKVLLKFNGIDAEGKYKVLEGLGYESGAIALHKQVPVSFSVLPLDCSDSLTIDIRLLPTHPVEIKGLAFCVQLDDKIIADNIHYETVGRSEEWKENVLRNQAIRHVTIANDRQKHNLIITPITEGVILDQILVYASSCVDLTVGANY